MTKLNRLLRRSAVRLLCLVAAILALSQSAGAWYVRGYIVKSGDTDTLTDVWNDGEDMGSDNSYTFGTVTSDKTIYFKIADYEKDGNKFYGGHSEYTFPENGGNYGVKSDGTMNNVSPLLINMKAGKTYTITFDGSNVVLKVTTIPSQLYFRTDANSWQTPYTMTKSSDGKQFSYKMDPYTANNTVKFHFRENQNDWNGYQLFPNSDNTTAAIGNNTIGNYKQNGSDPNKAWSFTSSFNKPVTFTVDFTDASNPVLKITQDNIGGGGDDETLLTYDPKIIGYWDGTNDWKTGRYANSVANGNEYTFKIKPNDDGKILFRIKYNNEDFYVGDGTATHTFGEGNNEYNVGRHSSGYTGSSHFIIENCRAEYVTITFVAKSNDYKIKTYYQNPKWESRKLPVYPIGTYSKAELEAYTEWPVYYLQSEELNYGRITPEYQFTKATEADVDEIMKKYGKTIKEGELFLVFAMRNTGAVWAEGFANATEKSVKYDEQKFDIQSSHPTEGKLYIAKFDPAGNGGEGKLEFIDLNEEMPFLSIIGKNWKQSTTYKTPHFGDDANSGQCDTDYGWQEAWIQYDRSHNIVKDIDGNVMFNTMWPPRNPIYFKTEFTIDDKNYDLTLDSGQLTLKPSGDETGEYWKGHEWFKNFKGESTLSEKEFPDELVLDNGRTYRLLRAENVWINDDNFKFWTGWNGYTRPGASTDPTQKDYNSAWHSNWGHYAASGDTKEIEAESTVPLFNAEGDMNYHTPVYFASVNFFYDVNDPAGKAKSVFFTERAYGGAQIGALNDQEYSYGMYFPELTDIDNLISGENKGKVKSVKITSWDTDLTEKQFDIMEKSGLDVDVDQFASIFEGEKTGNYIHDTNGYANGMYKYKMTVVIEDLNHNDHTINVVSNPFTIHKSQLTTQITAYQLVKVLKPVDGYNYVTFAQAGEAEGAERAYKVKVKVGEDDKDPELLGYELLSTLPNYADGTQYQFTCKVLLVSNRLSASERGNVIGYQLQGFDASGKTIGEDGLPHGKSVEYKFEGDKDGDDSLFPNAHNNYSFLSNEDKGRYFRIVEPRITVFKDETNPDATSDNDINGSFRATYGLRMKYKETFTVGEGDNATTTTEKYVSTPGSVDIHLVMPTPVLEEAHVELFYGDDTASEFKRIDATKAFSYEGRVLADARYQNVRKVLVIERPNITDRYRAKARKYVENVTDETLEGKFAPISNGMFGYLIGTDNTAAEDLLSYTPVDVDGNTVRYIGKTHLPSNFEKGTFTDGVNDGKIVTLEMKSKFKEEVTTFDRWTDGVITGISLDRGEPKITNLIGDTGKPYQVKSSSFSFNNAGHLIETIAVDLKFKTSELDFSDVNEAFVAEAKDGVATEPEDDGVNYARRYKVNSEDTDAAKPLLFGNAMLETPAGEAQRYFDYYYLSLVDTDQTWIVTDGNATSTMLLLTAKSLREGTTVTIQHDHGTWWEGMEKYIDPYCRGMQLHLSYLYPFDYYVETPVTSPMRAARAEASETQVVASNPATMEFPQDIPTSIEGITMFGSGSVKAGEGYIETRGEGIEIYGADGIRVASGEGRHEVPAGVYVVRLGGASQKVIVR